MFELHLSTWIIALLPLGLLVQFFNSYKNLRHIPGPVLAKWTDLWRLLNVARRHAEKTQLELHETYGDVVRLGPNCVSVRIPDLVESIYGIGKGFTKSDFYIVWHNMVNGRRVSSPVFETDEAKHAQQKRQIASAYQLSKLIEFEPFVDSTTAAFLQRIDEEFADTGKACDLGSWLQFYAFDVIGELTFSKRLGFLKQGSDVEGIIDSIAWNFDRCSILGQMPWLDSITWKNPIYTKYFAKPLTSPIMIFGQRRMIERLETRKDSDDKEKDIDFTDPELASRASLASGHDTKDFLSRFLASRDANPGDVSDKQILSYLFMNINAGSDTIATTLRAVFYHLLTDPSSLSKLRSEIDTAASNGKISKLFVTWPETQTLPYLRAVITEALRMHPALALCMERVVPHPGLKLPDKNATFLSPGTIVGINPWVLHRDVRIFGDDAHCWNPDRWLNVEDEKIKYMERNMLSFGAGKRSCLGKNIAMLEMYKVVPSILLKYDMELVDPGAQWQTTNSWILRQTGLHVHLKKRASH